MRNLDNFRQAVEIPKSWNSVGYICPKNTFFQLKHYIQRIHQTLLSTNFVKIHQIPHIWKHKSFFTTQLVCIILVQILCTFDKNSPPKFKFSDFLLLKLKYIKFLMSVFKQKVSLSSKFGSSVPWEITLLHFLAGTLYAIDKSSTSKCNFSDFWSD